MTTRVQSTSHGEDLSSSGLAAGGAPGGGGSGGSGGAGGAGGQGGEPVQTITLPDGQEHPYGIVADGSHVYWITIGATEPSGGLWVLPKAGGTATALVEGYSQVYDLVLLPVTGGTVELLAAGQAYGFGIAADGVHVYWVAGPSVMRAPPSSGQAVACVSGQTLPFMIALDADNLYWTDYGAGTVMRAPK